MQAVCKCIISVLWGQKLTVRSRNGQKCLTFFRKTRRLKNTLQPLLREVAEKVAKSLSQISDRKDSLKKALPKKKGRAFLVEK